MNIRGKGRRTLSVVATGILLAACSNNGSNTGSGETRKEVNPPIATLNPGLVADLGPYKTYGRQKLEELIARKEVLAKDSPALKTYLKKLPTRVQRAEALADNTKPVAGLTDPQKDKGSLILAFPVKLLGEQNLFGGVAIKVGDKTDENLGMLKLMELTPLHVRPVVSALDTDNPQLSLIGCASNCSERSKAENQLNIPVVGVDTENGTLLVDLSALGQKLNLISITDPEGTETELKPKSSYTTVLDYSAATLVFDVESDMIPVASDPSDPGAPVTKFTFRWYLKPASGFDPAFEVRDPVAAVGFFKTERAAKTRITRWGVTGTEEDTVHYFIKNVPEAHKAAFAAALEDWNTKLMPTFGRKVVSYEFLDANDPRTEYVNAGDVRFSVIEWDLNNKAPYGGFGPSIANQHTGEIFAANTLIQGPSVIDIYTKWFKVSGVVQALRAEGKNAEAAQVLAQFTKESANVNKIGKATVKMGDLSMKIGSTLPPLRDPMLQRGDFDLVPENETFESYMSGYFTEMVAHEVGHNLGLRHNFRGNLADDGSRKVGTTSRSVMEYLPRRFRYLDRISAYDQMAMAYGYVGTTPDHADWFCTDENVVNPMNVTKASPECSRDDATNDPFSYFSMRMGEAVGYLINRGSPDAPTWNVMDMQREVGQSMMGLAFYGAAAGNGSLVTNFAKEGRPTEAVAVRAYALAELKSHLCDPTLADELAKKSSDEARFAVQQNMETLRGAVARTLSYFGLYSPDELACE